jgi:hypothetical protein
MKLYGYKLYKKCYDDKITVEERILEVVKETAKQYKLNEMWVYRVTIKKDEIGKIKENEIFGINAVFLEPSKEVFRELAGGHLIKSIEQNKKSLNELEKGFDNVMNW